MFEKIKQFTNKQKNKTNIQDNSNPNPKSNSFINRIKALFEEKEKEEVIKPVGKVGLFAKRIQLSNPIGIFRRGYDITVEKKEEDSAINNIVLVKEKKFSKRLQFILLLMVLQSIPLSFAMTASISLPWTFNVVIPFSLNFLPFNLKEVIDSIILSIQNLLKPLNPLFDVLDTIFKFFSTMNPAVFFTGTMWFFDYLGWIDSKEYLNIPKDYNNGSKTSMDILAFNLEKKFPSMGNMVVPFLLVLFAIMSFFFLITKGKKLLFEMMKEKQLKKSKRKIRKPILTYYHNQGINELEYIENRSLRKRSIKGFFYSCIIFGLVVSLTPMFFALYLVFF